MSSLRKVNEMAKKIRRIWLSVDESMFKAVATSAQEDFRKLNDEMRFLIAWGLSLRYQPDFNDRKRKFVQVRG